MNIKEFKNLKLAHSTITQKGFSANIRYSKPGSGHYFTLSDLNCKPATLITFLKEWESMHTFCVETLDEHIGDALKKREYTTDEDGNWRIGVEAESRIDRMLRDQMFKKRLTSKPPVTKFSISKTRKVKFHEKEKVKKEIKKREAAE